MSLLDPASIPEFLLWGDQDSLEYRKAIRPMIDFSFVSLVQGETSEDKSFQVVDLVQVAAREWMRATGILETSQAKAIQTLSNRFQSGEYKTAKGWGECAILAPHIERILRYKIEDLGVSQGVVRCRASLLRNYTYYMWRSGQVETVGNRIDESITFHEQRLPNDRALILETKALRALAHNSLGQHSKAVEIHTKVLAERKKLIGQQHRQTLRSMNDLGQALRNAGRLKEARREFNLALAERKKVFGDADEDTLASRSDLARVLADMGEYSSAETELRKTLEAKEQTLEKDHPSTLATMELLAEVLAGGKKYSESEKLHRLVLELYISVLGRKHPDTIFSMSGLAAVLLDQKKFIKAEEMFRETLELWKEALTVDNGHAVKFKQNLAFVLREQDKYPEAEVLLREVVEALKKEAGETDKEYLNWMDKLAEILQKLGKEAEAEEMIKEIDRLDEIRLSQKGYLERIMGRLSGWIYGACFLLLLLLLWGY